MVGRSNPITIGLLALQGCIEPHKKHFEKLGVPTLEVRLPPDLDQIDGLVLPGGESTTMLRLLKQFQLWEPLYLQSQKIPFWGICAGSILMAREVLNPTQESLGVIDLKVKRNAYGRQLESRSAIFKSLKPTIEDGAEGILIRAPQFLSWGSGVKPLGEIEGQTVFLEQGQHMVTAFHPELTQSSWCHKYFLEKIRALN